MLSTQGSSPKPTELLCLRVLCAAFASVAVLAFCSSLHSWPSLASLLPVVIAFLDCAHASSAKELQSLEHQEPMKLLRPIIFALCFAGAFFYFTTYRPNSTLANWISHPTGLSLPKQRALTIRSMPKNKTTS